MLNAVIRLALRYRMLVVVLSLVLLAYGGYQATTLAIDVFPDLDRPRVVIMTESPGLAPEDVESLVSYPLESALLGATGVQSVRSQSGPGLSVVYVDFDWGTNIYTARQVVQERLAALSEGLPPGVKPQMAPISSIMGQIMIVGLRRRAGPEGGELAPMGKKGLMAERVSQGEGEPARLYVWNPTDRDDLAAWKAVEAERVTWSEIPGGGRRVKAVIDGRAEEADFLPADRRALELRTLADWVVRPRVLQTAGVAQVITMGGGRKQYQVLIDPTALTEYDVTLQQVEEALKKNNVNTSGGFAEVGGVERPIRILGRLGPRPEDVVKDLRRIPVKTTPQRTILLEQVARVTEGPQLKRGDASVNGEPGVVLTITKQPHVDTRDLTDRAIKTLRDAEKVLPADVVVETELFQLRDFIDRGVYNVGHALVIGAVLVLIILFLFLLNFRTTFISLTAIPLSLVITVMVFKAVGWVTGSALSINVMTLGGIAVAMGELVDDAIVDVENIFRRLKENNALPVPRPALLVVYEASMEIRSAIVFGTAVVILVFVPLFALSGIEGRLFAPLGVAYITSILASLVVSLTVTPVLSYYLLPQAGATHSEKDGPLLRVLKWLAGYLIRFSMRFAGPLLLLTWLLLGVSVWLAWQLERDFLPKFNEGTAQIGVTLPPGSSLEASNETAKSVDDVFRRLKKSDKNPDGEILSFLRRTGRAELDEHAEPPNVSEYIVILNPEGRRGRDEILEDLVRQIKEEAPGADIEAGQPLEHLMSHMLSGVSAQVAIKIYGDDLDKLRGLAEQVKNAIADVDGVKDLVVEAQQTVDELHIRLRPDDLAYYGVDRAYVAEFLQTALLGEVVSQVLEGQRRFDLLVRLEEPYRTDYAALGRLRIELPDGRGQVPLHRLADIGTGSGANRVNRDEVRRRIVVRCNVRGRGLGDAVEDIQQRVDARVSFPKGYEITYGGQFESQQRATRLITGLALLSVAGMFFVVYILFPSVRVVLQILNALPTAFIGGVIALYITDQTLTVAALVGFISLGGIAVRNGILLVTHYFHLMKEEGESFSEHMVLRGSLERLAPVLMTALTAGIGLIPLVVEGQKPGREVLYPVATVILGGLFTSTFCEFFLHPGLFWKFSGKDAQRLVQAGDEDEAILAGGHGAPAAVEAGGPAVPTQVAVHPGHVAPADHETQQS